MKECKHKFKVLVNQSEATFFKDAVYMVVQCEKCCKVYEYDRYKKRFEEITKFISKEELDARKAELEGR